MEKIYQIKYMYEIVKEEYVNEAHPDLGIHQTRSLTELTELTVGNNPAEALKHWEKKTSKNRNKKNRVYVIDISEYKVGQVEGKE